MSNKIDGYVKFMFFPRQYDSTIKRALGLVGSIAVGILTLGILHGVSAIIFRDRVFSKVSNPKIERIAQKRLVPSTSASHATLDGNLNNSIASTAQGSAVGKPHEKLKKSTQTNPLPSSPVITQRASHQTLPTAPTSTEINLPASQSPPPRSPQQVTTTSSESTSDPLITADLWLRLGEKTRSITFNFLLPGEVQHRFTNVPCPKETAITVDGKYLHANIVGKGISKRTFVASQAPLPAAHDLFWKAIFERDGSIIDLTTQDDRQTGDVTPYYPIKTGETKTYGSMAVTLIRTEGEIAEYQVTDTQTNTSKMVKRCNYDKWKDFSDVSIHTLTELVDLLDGPFQGIETVIHCRAGIGRTGTLITAAILKEKISTGEITKENLGQALLDIIIALRAQRGPGFVQQPVQLDLLKKYALHLLLTPTMTSN
jgi:protein tyrosine phosphatase